MAKKKRQVNVALDKEQYDRWNEKVEENGQYATMSGLVRKSVEKELARDDTRGSQSGGKEVAKLSERVEAMESAIQGLSGDFQELKGIVESQSPTNQNLKSEVFTALPEYPKTSTPKEIAAKIGGPVDTDTVAQVLEELAQNTGQVTQGFEDKDGENIIKYAKKGE